MNSRAMRRLAPIIRTLSTPIGQIKGHISLGEISVPVREAQSPSRLPSKSLLLKELDGFTLAQLRWILQKHQLRQDIFLLSASASCGYTRRLALSFCELINREYEYVAIHRDVAESELKQSREIKLDHSNGQKDLKFVDSPTVRAVKHGRVLILDGIEKAERGILPLLNNLLENREMNLEDGTQIVHPERYSLLQGSKSGFISAHPNFQVVCLGAPVPPLVGYPLDPPFRSRFQVRYIDHLGASFALAGSGPNPPSLLWQSFKEVVTSIQLANEARTTLSMPSLLPNFPQASLVRLRRLLEVFPCPIVKQLRDISPDQLACLMLLLHPRLAYLPLTGFGMLAEHLAQAGFGALGNPVAAAEDGSGLLGYQLVSIERVTSSEARATFKQCDSHTYITTNLFCGPAPLVDVDEVLDSRREDVLIGPRLKHLLTVMIQIHAIGSNITLLPSDQPSAPSASTSLLLECFCRLLGYQDSIERIHLYKELSGRELLMRRLVNEKDGSTEWTASRLVEAALGGSLVQLNGIDTIGSTIGSIGRLLDEGEVELWNGRRIVAQKISEANDPEFELLSETHPSFRLIATVTRSMPNRLKDWLSNDEVLNITVGIPTIPLGQSEEEELMRRTGASCSAIKKLSDFALQYRTASIGLTESSSSSTPKLKRLGTRTLIRLCKKLAVYPQEEASLGRHLASVVLANFLPKTERMTFDKCMKTAGIQGDISQNYIHPAPKMSEDRSFLIFPNSYPTAGTDDYKLRRWSKNETEDDSDSDQFVPHMPYFYDNSQQNLLMREIGVDLEVLKDHLVLLGNQGVGKNKIVDRLLQLLGRPREYIQLHRDSTVNQLMFQTNLINGQIQYSDSPLIRAVKLGRVLVIDEADKAPGFVTAIFKSLADHNELSLSDGRKIVPNGRAKKSDEIEMKEGFRMILLANRPGFPFLGNQFLDGLGDGFSCYSIDNPDRASEIEVVRNVMGESYNQKGNDLVERLVDVFHDLRQGFAEGTVTYPFSLRELINLVRHLKEYDQDSLETGLRNIFDFDVYRPETIDFLHKVMQKHGIEIEKLGMNSVRKSQLKSLKDEPISQIVYRPVGDKEDEDLRVEKDENEMRGPKPGKEDDGKEHVGGNTWAGGTGGRDTSGLGGRGGATRVYKRSNIYQVSDQLKAEVPEYIKERARQMSQQELARKLEDLNMSSGQATNYDYYFKPVRAHISQLQSILENHEAKEEERVWIKRQGDGELDELRLVEGLTGDSAIYKRRSYERPEPGKPQVKPKRIRFLFDISASMYRFQADGRLDRSCQTAVMIMEAFERLERPERYVWDIVGHAGDSPEIPLVKLDDLPKSILDRWKVIEKIKLFSQYAIAGDHTIEAIEKGVDAVAEMESDEAILIIITDANFDRYGISSEILKKTMNRNEKVKTGLIAIGEGNEAEWLPKVLPYKAYQVKKCEEIPIVFKSILSQMLN
ncbi:AAA domain-containing protein [Phakopsora pachyrhizi]|uniref:AAA domain-domain-containing protein n=1 Tax=Phakopsora pachyrhizi TaxID=170000 RepID=A0AAV0BNW4_PHAPC|nr:AAA domain-containing protein [Phakopsora pachyrhizi]CAH7688707.1 AAA domain-domain-containing protein [Phakopsora pachyrhizi]